jgi:hypothetical protein
MKIRTISNNAIFIILLIGTGIAALYIGHETFSRYPNAVLGIQGFATLYLINTFAKPKLKK